MRAESTHTDDVIAQYEQRRQQFETLRDQLARRVEKLSNGRLLAFLAGIAALIYGAWFTTTAGWPWYVLGGCLLAGFMALVSRHRRVRRERDHAASLELLNRHGIARVRRDWRHLPEVHRPDTTRSSRVAEDLDLFGHASVYQLTCTAATSWGKSCLAEWLLEGASPEAIRQRQAAVGELAGSLAWRQEFYLQGRPDGHPLPDPSRFLDWAEGPPWLAHRKWLLWTARTTPLLMVLLLAAGAVTSLPMLFLGPILALNVAISYLYLPQVHSLFERISQRQNEFRHYALLLQRLSESSFASAELQRLQQTITTQHVVAHRQLRRLKRWIDCADLRYSQQMYLIIQGLTLWDFHVLAGLERWQREVGIHVRQWLESLAQFEALCSLASLAHDNPDWNFPEITTADPPRSFEAQQLAHPLLSASSRVANDVALEGSGTFLLVTGSNMSGKSTLLRTIGTNAVLAQAGAPICGQSLRMPPLVIETSMRIQDSLEDGVSFFMAELKRLKEVVDSARALDLNPSRCLLYLLDEILQGTNSAERQIAVRRVIGHLLAHGAIGAISTHDLELANEPPLDSAARRVHFRETITEQATGRGMTFDYRLREGIATTTNALALLDLVGLTHEEEDA